MSNVTMQIKSVLSRWDVWAFMLCSILFNQLPEIDLWVSDHFYNGVLFPAAQHPLIEFIYRLFAKIHLLYLVILLIGLAITYSFRRPLPVWRKRLSYLLIVLLLGPGLLVNLGLKDNSFGRPRPIQIEAYGGKSQFSPAFSYSGVCHHNCSFVSGHAAVAFYLMALGWAFGRRWVFVLGVILGIVVGAVRISQGGHFLSDVVFSFWTVYFVSLITARYFNLRCSALVNRPLFKSGHSGLAPSRAAPSRQWKSERMMS